jgi:hypothetical protein
MTPSAPMGTIAIATTVVQAMPSHAIRVGTPKGKPKPPKTAIDGHDFSEELHRGGGHLGQGFKPHFRWRT